MNAIELNRVNVWYGRFHALKDVSFEIPEGVISGFVGPNGAGKTTTIKAIMSLLPYDGEIKKSSESIGYLSEDEGYYEYMTAYEYLRYFAKLYGIKDVDKKVMEILDIVGLKGRENDLIKDYSKGMKRRLGIGRTLLSESKIIILDEPLSGLDPKIKAELRGILSKISEEKTFLISSHQLRDIEEICNWIILINKGKIVSYGKPDDILKKLKPHRIITLSVNLTPKHLEEIKNIDGVKEVRYKEGSLTIVYEEADDSALFQYFIQNNLKFTLKGDSLESIYREVYK